MPFQEELRDLSLLMRLSAKTVAKIAGHGKTSDWRLDGLAEEIYSIADRLMTIGCETPPIPKSNRQLHS